MTAAQIQVLGQLAGAIDLPARSIARARGVPVRNAGTTLNALIRRGHVRVVERFGGEQFAITEKGRRRLARERGSAAETHGG